MNDLRISDDMILEAFDRRAHRATPMGLRGSILEATASTRQRRRPWRIHNGGGSLRLLAVAALLVAGLAAGTIFVGSPLVAEKPTTAPVAEEPTTAPLAEETDDSRGCRRTRDSRGRRRLHDRRVLPALRIPGRLDHPAQDHRYTSEWERSVDRLHGRGRRPLPDGERWDHRTGCQGRHGLLGERRVGS